MVENFLWLQNHFLENRFQPKNFHQSFLVHNFYGGKIISSELNMNQIFFGWKCFMVAKSFPRKQVWTKNFHKNFFGRKFFMVAKKFPTKQVWTKNFHKKFFDRKIFGSYLIPRKWFYHHKHCGPKMIDEYFWFVNGFRENILQP